MISRRLLLLSALAGTAATPARAEAGLALTPQDRADVTRIEAYLNGIKTLRARFLQVAPDGGVTEGELWMERPGRMRFQYSPPAPFLLVAGHGLLNFEDTELKQSSTIPLNRTPLGILLAERVALTGDVTVTGIERLPGQLQVGVVRTASPGEGSLTLVFADKPLTLRQWTVLDAQRQETRVTLYDMELGGRFDPRLFEFVAPANPSGGG